MRSMLKRSFPLLLLGVALCDTGFAEAFGTGGSLQAQNNYSPNQSNIYNNTQAMPRPGVSGYQQSRHPGFQNQNNAAGYFPSNQTPSNMQPPNPYSRNVSGALNQKTLLAVIQTHLAQTKAELDQAIADLQPLFQTPRNAQQIAQQSNQAQHFSIELQAIITTLQTTLAQIVQLKESMWQAAHSQGYYPPTTLPRRAQQNTHYFNPASRQQQPIQPPSIPAWGRGYQNNINTPAQRPVNPLPTGYSAPYPAAPNPRHNPLASQPAPFVFRKGTRLLANIRALANRLGWEVTTSHSDRDVSLGSAYNVQANNFEDAIKQLIHDYPIDVKLYKKNKTAEITVKD